MKKKKKLVGVTQMTQKKKRGGVDFNGKEKVKNTVTLQPRQGKWIPLSCNLSQRCDSQFLYPVLFNTIVKCNLVASKFSPQAGDLLSPAVYIFNNNNIFVQVRKGESLGKIIQLKMQGGPGPESRGKIHPFDFCGHTCCAHSTSEEQGSVQSSGLRLQRPHQHQGLRCCNSLPKKNPAICAQ